MSLFVGREFRIRVLFGESSVMVGEMLESVAPLLRMARFYRLLEAGGKRGQVHVLRSIGVMARVGHGFLPDDMGNQRHERPSRVGNSVFAQ